MTAMVKMMNIDSLMPKLEMPGLTFEEISHTYRLDGAEIPSVSNVMEPLRDAYYGGINQRTLAQAADKGHAVHNSIENWIKFEIDDIPEAHRGYFNAFLEWWDLRKPIVVGSEIRLFHKLLMYGGTLDLLCYIDGELNLIDFKSTYAMSEMLCRVQLEAYAQGIATHGVQIDKKRILHLKKDGKWNDPVFEAKDAVAWRVFGSLKNVYDYVHSYK